MKHKDVLCCEDQLGEHRKRRTARQQGVSLSGSRSFVPSLRCQCRAPMGENVLQRDSWFVPSSINPLFLSQLHPAADLAVAAFLTFTCVVSFLGNGMALLVYWRKRKKLRPPELMTINLALCDLGFCIFGVPFFIISSLCHAWVFGDTGCLWYSIQGFVFGIGSLLTTCLISLDRCLKICCLRYGQWIERRHVSLSIALVWVYTFFWALLPLFGFGSYGPEPYGTSCTINWWGMRSFVSDRIYIFLVLVLCFGVPALTILASYLAILLKVFRSNRTLASISSSSVSHTSKDLKLAKMAAVVCASFLVAWTPYAAASLICALVPSDDQEASLQTVMEDSTSMASSSSNAAKILDIPSLLNSTATEYYRQIFFNPDGKWNNVNIINSVAITSDPMFGSTQERGAEPVTRSPQQMSHFSPLVTLIPAMFAKSHCMINPFIYQIMNRDFRDDVYVIVFGQEKAERRQMQRREEGLGEGIISISFYQSWKRKSSDPVSLTLKRTQREQKRGSNGQRKDNREDDIRVGSVALDLGQSGQHGETLQHCWMDNKKKSEPVFIQH